MQIPRETAVTNWEYYFGTPERAAGMEVVWHSWPIMIVVYRSSPMSACTCCHQIVAQFRAPEEYRAWLDAEYDDGTIVFED